MTLPFPQPILCPVLIGRAPQFDTLRQLIDTASAGQLQMALIAGETGVGKSRLVAEAKAYAAIHGFVLLQGTCFSQDRACPYAPLIDLLRAHFASSTPAAVAAEVAPFTADLSLLLPDLLPEPVDPLMPPAHDPEQQRRRLFDALANCLVRRFAPQPILLIVEDLHWADEGSLEFLLYLARRSAGQPLLMIGTYRSDEVDPSLARWLAQIERERLACELLLLSLNRDEVAAMMRAIFALPRPVRAEFLDAIFTLSEGNPFTVEELLTSLVMAGDIFYADGVWDRKPMHELRIPRNRREAVQARVAQLKPNVRQLLSLASVIGRRFDFALLQHLTQQTEDTIIALIKELIDAQLVVEESADQFAFRHALTRQAIYTGLLTRERAGLHRVIAEALEQTSPDSLGPHVADLADHFFEAGIWERALMYARQAGARAQDIGAPYAAITYYSRALEATTKLGLVGHPELILSRGHAYEMIGDFERALDDYLQGLNLARAVGDGIVEWRALSALGQLWTGREYAQAGDWYRQALDHALALGDPSLRAHSLNQLGNWLINTGQATAGLQAHHQALTLFQAQHDQQGMAETRDVLGMACALAGDLVGAAQHYHAAIDLLRILQDQRNLSSSLAVLAIITSPGHAETTANLPATFEHCRASATEALQLARQLDWRAGQSFAEWQIGLAAASFGQFGAALAHATESLRIAHEIEHQQWIVGALFTLGATYIRMLAPDAARAALLAGLPLAQALGSTWWIGNLTSYLVFADLQQHELARAATALEKVMPLDTLPTHPLRTLAERRVGWAWGELALAQGAPEQALRIAEQLLESAPGAADDRPIPSLLHLKGAAMLAMQQPATAAQALEAAQQGAERRGELPLLWQTQRALGQAYQRLRRRKQAQTAFATARKIVDTLAATIDMVDAREHFVRTAGATLPTPRPLTPERAIATRFASLTARERAVARLIAQGMANQEIADALILSKRTIETHVGSILAKLQVTTRTQIARWAITAGLLDDLAEPTP